MKTIYEKLNSIQATLIAKKGQYNKFGGYSYRSAEDILEALKPHLQAERLVLTMHDDIVMVGDRIYVRATARLSDVDGNYACIETSAFAREEESKKGMDGSQVTGAASSYARKYALNGMFAIDDCKDADTNEQREQAKNADTKPEKKAEKKQEPKQEKEKDCCTECGKPIVDTELNGQTYSAEQIKRTSMKKHNRVLCMACYMAENRKEKQ